MKKYEVSLGAFLTIFASALIEVEAENEDKAKDMAVDLAIDQWQECYPSLDDVGMVTIDGIAEEIEV